MSASVAIADVRAKGTVVTRVTRAKVFPLASYPSPGVQRFRVESQCWASGRKRTIRRFFWRLILCWAWSDQV